MNYRQIFLNKLKGVEKTDLFMPDITDWYNGNKISEGQQLLHSPGEAIFDDDPIKKIKMDGLGKFDGMSLLDIYRKYDMACFFHIYDWKAPYYDDTIQVKEKTEGGKKTVDYITPIGKLFRSYKLCADGSWCPVDYLLKGEDDFKILFYILEREKYLLNEDIVTKTLNFIGDRGYGDLAIYRSPFGKLVHEYLGFKETCYLLYDNPGILDRLLEIQEIKDLELIDLACRSSCRLVIISDHADENLISPPWYKEYCIPFYRKACEILHKSGKMVSTHLDGNIKGLLPLFKDTGFDLLDGCTPSPMFNYQPEELANALSDNMRAFVGVPASMFVGSTYTQEAVNDYAKRLKDAFGHKVIINVGDILSKNGDIEKVIRLNEYIKNGFAK